MFLYPKVLQYLKVITCFTSLYPEVLKYLFPQNKGVLLHHPSTVIKFSRFNIDTILLFIFFGHATWLVGSGILVSLTRDGTSATCSGSAEP